MSGEYVGILDPHRKHIDLTREDGTIESGQLLEISEFCQYASHSTLFEGMFGFSFKSGKEFEGTIFRFPFRKKDVKSHLSDTVYNADKVISDLYQSFQLEAARVLLFLKHVTAIELYTWNIEGSCQEHYLSVMISPSCLRDVNLMRNNADLLCDCSLQESSSTVTDLYTCKVEVTGPAETDDDDRSTVQVYNWLVSNTIGTSKSRVKHMAQDLKVAPWVGVAVQVPTEFVLATGCTLHWKDFSLSSEKVDIDIVKAYEVLQEKLKQLSVEDIDATSLPSTQKGYAFCFLPLPEPTGLPVNVHGYFRVADNRRSIKWPAPDVKGNDAKWNEELVHSLLIPSYAILLAARTKLFTFSNHGDSPYSWWPDPHCVKYSPTWSSIIPDLSHLLLQLPVFWTGADGGKWVSQDGAIFLPPMCPPSVADLLLQLGFAVVHIPSHVLQCFDKTAINFASKLEVCQYLKCKSSEAQKMMSSNITVVHEFLKYFADSCEGDSHLIGLPIILLSDPGLSPAFLQEKGQGDTLYVMLDKSSAAMLPGLENRIISFDVPNDVAELYTKLAETEKFQLQVVSPKVVAASLLNMSMSTWCNPGTEVLWTPDKNGHPSREWLMEVWEWLAKQEVASKSSTEFVLDMAKGLPIVPVESLDNTVLAETALLSLSEAITGVILQMPLAPDKDTIRISCVCQKLGIKIVQYSSALNKLAYQIVQTLNPLALLQALMKVDRQSYSISVRVKALENEERDRLRKYLESSIDAKQVERASSPAVRACVEFLKSIPFHTVRDRNGIYHSTLSAQIIFLAPEVTPPASIPLSQPLLCYTASEFDFYKVLLGRNPELLATLVQNHILPNLQVEEDNTQIFLWILQILCESDSNLITILKATSFLPAQNGRLHCPCELFDPEDEQLRNFLSAGDTRYPHQDFTGHELLVKLRWLGIQTWSLVCSTEQLFIRFALAQAQSLANVSREEGLKKSKYLVNKVASSEFCNESFAALADVPFLFCEMHPPSNYISSLSWFGQLYAEKAHRPTEIYASTRSDLSLIVGSVCPILCTEYRKTPELNSICCQASTTKVVAQLRNVACLPENVLQDEQGRVTVMMHQVYSYLNNDANSIIELDAPSSIWHPQQALFVPLIKVALHPSSLCMTPYRFDISQLDDMGQYMKLWKALGVKKSLDDTDCGEVLLEIQAATNDISLAENEMKVVHSILQYLKSKDCKKGALLPTKRRGLINPLQCVFDDCEWLVKYPELARDYSVVLKEVPRELAQYFGAVPLSQRIANPVPLEINVVPEHETRPVEALVRERLNLYQHEVDPFLSMIQIADSAGATSVKFIFDWRSYAKRSLFSEQMAELQGPALLVIINDVLNEETLKHLCSIGSVNLDKSPESLPHLSDGHDFCSIYHLSDLPMLWNGTKLLVFDPLQAYVFHLTSKPSHGVQFNTVQNMAELRTYYGDQLKPFLEVSSYYSPDTCSTDSNHALFRLPFRSASKEYTRALSESFTPPKAKQAVSAFVDIADSLLVFLQNVREVEFCEVGMHSPESLQMTSLLSVVKATIPVPPVIQSVQSDLTGSEVKSTMGKEVSFSKWLVVSQPTQGRVRVDLAVSIVQEGSSFLITSPPNGQNLFSSIILNHTVSPWQNCLVNVCIAAAGKKQLRVWPTTESDVLIDASSDSVLNALLSVLTIAQEYLGISGLCLAEENLNRFYYKLWPTDPRRVPELLDKADSAQTPIVYTVGGTWESLQSCVVMNEEFRQPPFLTLYSCFQEILRQAGYKVADIPKCLMESSMRSAKVMNFKTLCKQVFFGNIHTLPKPEMHKVLFFILEHYQLLQSMNINLDEEFKSNRCIPTAPHGQLNVPQALIDRNSLTIGRLYSEEDERFVTDCSEKVKATLKELGMKSDRITDEDVIERAHSVSKVTCHGDAQERSRQLLNYLFSIHQCNDSLGISLSKIPFLPAALQQISSQLARSGDAVQLYCSEDLYLPLHQNLVFTQCPVLDPSIDSRCHKVLQFKGEPPTAVVLNHLVALVKCVSVVRESMTQEDWKAIDSSVQAVYDNLDAKAQQNAESLKAQFDVAFQDQGMIWDSTEKCFLKRDTVALKLPVGLSTLKPYRKTVADVECLRQNGCLWKTLKVKEEFDVHDCVQVLLEMQGMCSEQPMAEQHIRMVVDILCFMQRHECKEGALIPTTKGTLCSPDRTVFDDRRWSEKSENLQSRFIFAHSNVPGEVAHYFGVHPVSSKIASPQQLKLKFKVKERGQRESLTRRLRGIVEDYKDNIDVFKELIQNADDAGATEVKFLLDWRQHPRENLFTDELAQWQGPALYAYNDSVFSDEDFANICELGGATKRCNPLKIGRFGLGFCATYHLTDVPSFVSRTQLTIFDPHRQYISDIMAGDSPGLCVDIVEGRSDLQDFLSGHVAVYEDLFGCSLVSVGQEGFQGTLFRFPFRTHELAEKSKISNTVIDQSNIEQLTTMLYDAADTLLVFLRNVASIELYELPPNGHPSGMERLLSVTKKRLDSPADLIQRYVSRDGQSEGEATSTPEALEMHQATSRFIIVKQGKGIAEEETHWLVASALDSGSSSGPLHTKPDEHIPFAEVAVQVVEHNSRWMPCPVKGYLYCFLPLPISTELKVIVNGYFEVSKDRRSLTDIQDKSQTDTWNIKLISGAVTTAFLGMLTQLLKLNGSSCEAGFVEAFYGLWPTIFDQDAVTRLLVPHLFSSLFHDRHLVVPTLGQEWVPIVSACVLDDLFSEKVPNDIRSSAVQLLLKSGYNLADIPTRIQETVRQLGQSVTLVSFKEYSTRCLFPVMGTLDAAVRDEQVLFILRQMKQLDDSSRWLADLLCASKCVPCEPESRLLSPSDLIDPNSPLACLYNSEEERFPTSNYSEEAVESSLRDLGMKYHKLADSQIIEQASSAQTLRGKEQMIRVSNVLNYLFGTHLIGNSDEVQLLEDLSEVAFLPSAVNCGSPQLPWSGNAVQLYCSEDLYLPLHQNLVFTQCPVLDPSIDSRCHKVLQFKGEPPTAVVLNHLVALVKCVNVVRESMTQEDWKAIDSSVKAVYDNLDAKAQQNAESLKAQFDVAFQDQGMIWDSTEKCFLKRDTVALKLPVGLSTLKPYRKTVADVECLRQNGCLWKTLEVKEEFDVHDCVQVLLEIQGMCSEQPMAEQHIRMVVDILWFMQKHECKEGALIPTTKGTLCSPDRTVFDDRRWSEKSENLQSRFIFAHSNVPGEVAHYFGVHPVSSKIASPQQLKLKFKVKERGQRESLTRRLRGIVEDYKDNIDVFKELIQNADDAGATEVKFLLDWRQHPRENLFTDELAQWQGPALYAYNDSVFSDEDFANICELGGATKRCNPLKIGRFGLGFCATYHLTDVPSFVSRTQLTIFDPHRQYISDIMAGDSPGLCVDIVEGRSDLQDFLSGHVAVYEDLFGCSLISVGEEGFQGTLFRFPFRTHELAEKSKISNTVIDQSNIEQLTTMLYDAADTLLVFLRNVTSIELYELPPNGHPSGMERLLSVTKKRLDSPADLIQRYVSRDNQSEGEATSTPEALEMHQATSRFIIVKQGKGIAEEETHWLVASALDSGSSSGPLHTKPDEHIPFAEVAVQVVEHNSRWMPCPVKGYLYCFLPLPISTELKVIVNGYFEVSKDRRSLTDIQDKSQTDTWNTKLISGAVTTAFLEMLTQLLKLNGSSCEAGFVEAFYGLWPTIFDQDAVTRLLVPHFFSRLFHDRHLVVSTLGQEWVPIASACVLDDLFSEKVPNDIRSSAVQLLLKSGYKLAGIPTRIQETIRQLGQSVTLVSFKEYSTRCLFPVMGTLDAAVRDEQVLFILRQMKQLDDSSRWLADLLCASKCVPCEPESRLLSPSDLIDPNSPLACLYNSEEERFPTSNFSEEAVVSSLRDLGMKYYKLADSQVIERASSTQTLRGKEQMIRVSNVLNYLFGTHLIGNSDEAQLLEDLSEVAFLPAAVNCGSPHLPWSGNAVQLYCSEDLYLPLHQNLVFAQCPVLDPSIDSRCHKALQFKSEPSVETVVAHFISLVDSSHQTGLTDEEWKAIDNSVCAVYQYLNAPPVSACVECSIESALQTVTDKGLFVWDSSNRCFLSKSLVALKLPAGLHTLVPYRKSIDQAEYLKDYQNLWQLLRVKGEFDAGDCVDVLMEMKTKGQVPEEDISMAVSILHFLSRKKWTAGALIPTINNELINPRDAVYDDRKWSEKKGLKARFRFVHSKIPAELAKSFGVPPLSSLIASPQQLKIKVELTGHHESLTQRLKGIIEDYRDSIDVLKELIQNADDAGATEVKFLLDWRQHPRENLFTDELAQWQGPALYAYNNSVFSDEDFANICELGGATKKFEPTKIGQFGLGFCSVYNVTDVPSFVSRDRLVMFDPSRHYLKGLVSHENPGLSINFVEEGEDLAEFYRGHVETFQGIFGCDLLQKKHFPNTLFRLPFRTKSTACRSEILKEEFLKDKVLEMKKSFKQSVEYNLMFLQHVTMVQLYEMPEKSSPKGLNKYLLFSVTKTTQERLPGDPVQHMLLPPSPAPPYSVLATSSNVTSSVQDDPTQYQSETKQFSIRVYYKGSEARTCTWLVSSAVGGQRMKQLNECATNLKKGTLLPKAEVAVRMEEDEEGTCLPHPVQGKVFCFLPLPIDIEQKFLINGCFTVSKDRRHLSELEDSAHATCSWNRLLIQEPLTQAVLKVLHSLTTKCYSHVSQASLQRYYSLWPLVSPTDHPLSRELKQSFKKAVHDSDYPLLWSLKNGGMWLPVCEASVLDTSFSDTVFDKLRGEIMSVLVMQQYNMVDISEELYQGLTQGAASVTKVSVLEYYTEVLLPNLDKITDTTVRDSQILFLVTHFQMLKKIAEGSGSSLANALKTTCCIPCEPNGHLSLVEDLLLPTKTFRILFKENEERFPCSEFLHNAKQTLIMLGMHTENLKEEDVVTRADIVPTLPEEEAGLYCSTLASYLAENHSTSTKLLDQLSGIPFFPLHMPDSSLKLPWYKHADHSRFACPKDVYHPRALPLVFTFAPVANEELVGPCLEIFKLKHTPSGEEVWNHTKKVVAWAAACHTEISEVEKHYLNDCMATIYAHLEMKLSTSPDFADLVQKECGDLPFLWQDRIFHKPSQMVHTFTQGESCYPYLVKVNKELLEFPNLLKVSRVESIVTIELVETLLKRIFDDHGSTAVGAQLVYFVRALVSVVSRERKYQGRNFYLPDTDEVMQPSTELVNKEFDDSSDINAELVSIMPDSSLYLHTSIPKQEAKCLGVKDVLSVILGQMIDPDFAEEESFEQHEPLEVRINNILAQYRANESIFREFIQNADDACATEIAFVLDHRCSFGTQSLAVSGNTQKWKTLQNLPSLLIYNNRKFSEKDIKGISKLGLGSKQDEANKIGHFGLGFNAAYHVTDCPMLLSHDSGGERENFCVFDPLASYLPQDRKKSRHGLRYKLKGKEKAAAKFADQFEPFLLDPMSQVSLPGCFGDSTALWPNGYVVFRLPLTRSLEPSIYLRNAEKMTEDKLKALLDALKVQAPEMLLFLNHVQRITVLEISQEGIISDWWSVGATSNSQAFASELNQAISILKNPDQVIPKSFSQICDAEMKICCSSNSEEQTMKWVVCHRFGGSDMSREMIRDNFEKQHLLPVAAVAAPVHVCRGADGQLFCSLPVSDRTDLPVHIHGQFTVDPSRKFLETSDWNSALTETVARAYAELLVYCRRKVSLSKETQTWYYSLFPSSVGSTMDVLKPVAPKVYQQLLKMNAEILLAANSKKKPACLLWHALSCDNEAENKGWFPSSDHAFKMVAHVLVSIGMNIVVAPTALQWRVESLESSYHGAVAPHLVRAFLRKIAQYPDYNRHKKIISQCIVPLLSYVLQDINSENVAEVEGLPLMLSDSGEFKQIQMGQPLFTLCFVDLIPQHSKCREKFVSPTIQANSDLYLKLQTLQLLTCITAEVIAANIELPRNKVVAISECNHVLLQLLWEYILDYNPERRQHMLKTTFGSLAIVPTNLKTVVPVNMALTVLKHYGSVPLLSQLELPVVDFTNLSIRRRSTTSTGQHIDEATNQAIAVTVISPLLSDPTEPLAVMVAIEAHEPPVGFHPKGREDVMNFISFLLKCPHLQQHASTLRKLKIFELALEQHKWMSVGEDDEMCAVNCNAFPLRSLQPLQLERIKICWLYENCEKFFEALGISVPTPAEFYRTIIFPVFASHTFSAESKIVHLEFILEDENMWKDLQGELKKCHFIECNGKFCSPMQLFDPTVKLLTTFLHTTAFPQQPWSDQRGLLILRKLGLLQKVSDEEVKRFAETVQNLPIETAKKKSCVLLRYLKDLIKEGKRENDLDKVRKILSLIADIDFIPRFVPPHMITSLTDIGVAQLGIESSGFVCLQGSVVSDAEHASLASLCKPVILTKQLLPKYVDETTRKRLYISAGVTPLSTEIVIENLLCLVRLVEVCQITSTTKCRDALHSLQDTFKNHYQFLSKHAGARSLKAVPCIFVPSSSGDSFQVVQGDKLVERVSHESRPYCHLLCVVPDYLNGASLQEFREQVGIQHSLNASHFLSLLKNIHNDMQQQKAMNSRCDPNLSVAANAAYRDLVLLLCGTDDASREAERYVTSVTEGGDHVYLPSRTGQLFPSEELTLCDDDWIKDKLTTNMQPSFEFISPPPVAAHSLPSCLKVRKLSELVTEEINNALLKDEYNLCTKEVHAKQHGLEHGCNSVITLLSFVQAPEFKVGIQRIMHHKLAGVPLAGDCERALEKILRMDCVCVQKIQTCFKYNGKLIPGARNQDKACFLATEDGGEPKDDSSVADPTPVLYVRFHDNVDDLLSEVVMQLNKVLGPFISDTQHLQAILKCVTEPGRIQGALDHLHIKRYTSSSTVPDRVMLSSQPEVEDNELIIVCNFRANEQVMHCDAHGLLKVCTVESVIEAHTSDSHPLPPSLRVCPPDHQGTTSTATAADVITSLLVCKFLSPGQMQQLKALLNGQLDNEGLSSAMSGDKLVLLEIPQTDSEQLQRYLVKVMSLLNSVSNDQKYFVIERLLFHLHFLNQVRQGSLEFESVAKVFVKQVQKWFKGVAGDHTQFIGSLEKKISVLRDEVPEEADVSLSPPLSTCMDQTTKSQLPPPSSSGAQGLRTHHLTHYSSLSSWSTRYPNSYGRHGSSTAGAHGPSTGAPHHAVASQSTGLSSYSGTSGSSGPRRFPISGHRPQVSVGLGAGTIQPINIWQPRANFYTPVVEQQPVTSAADAQMWLTQACHDLKLAQQLVDLVQSPGAAKHEQGGGAPSACEYPEAICFYSHEIVEKALKAVFLAYCGLKHELAASDHVVDLFEKLKNSPGCPEEVKDTDKFIHLVSRHGRCCRFPDDNLPPAAPVLSHSTATAKETLSAALKFLKAVSKLQLFRDYFPDDTMEISIKKLTEEAGILLQ